jgi:hypothetical protein
LPALVRWLLSAAVLAGLATGCGASDGGASPAAAARGPAVAGRTAAATGAVTPSAAAMDRSRFFAILSHNGDTDVLRRSGITDARLEALFHRACDDIHRGASVDDTFVKYQQEVSAGSGTDADALASAFADAWGAGLVAFCPDVTGR